MTVSIVANEFVRDIPIFSLQKLAESSRIRPSACCTLNSASQQRQATGRLLSPEYNDQNITNGGPPCSSSVYSFKRPRSIYVEQL